MPAYPDAVLLLRQLRPPPDDPAADPALLERILAAPPPRGPRRHGGRRLALAAVALTVLAITLTPLVRSSPDVVARAAAALNDPETILHFRTEVRHGAGGRAAVTEVWQTAGARQQRMLVNGTEWVEDWDTGTSLAYDPERNVLIRHAELTLSDPDQRAPKGFDVPSPIPGSVNPTDDLARQFERARRGEGRLRLVGPARVRGIDVHELEFEFTIQTWIPRVRGEMRIRRVKITRTVYVDRETFLPVRVLERARGWPDTITEFVVAERLPRTPANELLLRMSPHPGARLIVERRLKKVRVQPSSRGRGARDQVGRGLMP